MWAEANNYFYRGRLVAKTKGGSMCTAPEIVLFEEPEPNGMPLRFVDIPAMVEKNRDLLEKLAAETIKKIYNTYVEYMAKVDEFWASAHSLGTNKVKNLKSFLNDSEVTVKGSFSSFGEVIARIGIDSVEAWALMLCNLTYTSELNWWIKNISFNVTYTPDSIYALLDDTMSKNSRSHIVSAYKNILISTPQLSVELGLGSCDYELKNGKRIWNTVVRLPWAAPNPRVILYSLFKFAEACGDYYQFTLSRLLNHDIDSDGVSPTEIFGLDRDQMEKILNGLSINYPDFINASFTLDLDNITLNSEKSSKDVLNLF